MSIPGIDLAFDASTTDQSQRYTSTTKQGVITNSGINFAPPRDKEAAAVMDLRNLVSGGNASYFSNPVNVAWGLGIVGLVLLVVGMFRRKSS